MKKAQRRSIATRTKRTNSNSQSVVPYKIEDYGLVEGEDPASKTNGYCLRLPGSYIDYQYRPANPDLGFWHTQPVYWILMIHTQKARRNRGLATQALTHFFRDVVGRNPGPVYPGYYDKDGVKYLRHVVMRLAKQFNITIRE